MLISKKLMAENRWQLQDTLKLKLLFVLFYVVQRKVLFILFLLKWRRSRAQYGAEWTLEERFWRREWAGNLDGGIGSSESERVLPEVLRQSRPWHPTPVLLPGKSHGPRSLVAAVHGVAKSPTHWVTSLSLFTSMHWRSKWQPTPVSCLENPRDGGAWWAAVYGAAQSQTRLKWLSSSSSKVLWRQTESLWTSHGSEQGIQLFYVAILRKVTPKWLKTLVHSSTRLTLHYIEVSRK